MKTTLNSSKGNSLLSTFSFYSLLTSDHAVQCWTKNRFVPPHSQFRESKFRESQFREYLLIPSLGSPSKIFLVKIVNPFIKNIIVKSLPLVLIKKHIRSKTLVRFMFSGTPCLSVYNVDTVRVKILKLTNVITKFKASLSAAKLQNYACIFSVKALKFAN